MSLRRGILALHRRLLPDREEIGWTPYLWLFYLLFFIVPWFVFPVSGLELVLGVATLPVFLALYFCGFWVPGRRTLWVIAGILLIAVAWTPWNQGAMTFFIYAAAFAGSLGDARLASRVVVTIASIAVTQGWWLGYSWFWMAASAFFVAIIGANNTYDGLLRQKNAELRRSREDVERMAAMAERERIGRDLHDLLGHTLSLINLKAQLAHKLAERGDPRAAGEIAEVEKVSRDALRQVREAVAGYRQVGLRGELANARLACEAMSIEVRIGEPPGLEPDREAVLAMVVREAVTNVIRHSGAGRCEIHFRTGSGVLEMAVADDGSGARPQSGHAISGGRIDERGAQAGGHGLHGMRQRLASVGGELRVETGGVGGRTGNGWRIRATVPFTPADHPAAEAPVTGSRAGTEDRSPWPGAVASGQGMAAAAPGGES